MLSENWTSGLASRMPVDEPQEPPAPPGTVESMHEYRSRRPHRSARSIVRSRRMDSCSG